MNYIITPINHKVTLPKRGYFTLGDNSEDVGIIATFLATNFMGFEYKTGIKINNMLGSYFGLNLQGWIKEFQRICNIEIDGNIGKITLSKLRSYGLDC